MNKEISVAEAIEVLRNELRKDKTEGSYYHAWQCNIAMAFKDEFERRMQEKFKLLINPEVIHEIANSAAKNFLHILI